MNIAEQFAGLQMEQLIAAPLSAAADASVQLAKSTADFIDRVGFDREGKLRTADFGYRTWEAGEDGFGELKEMKVAVPLLSVVPIPNLQIDEVNILFDMEVRQTEKSESVSSMSGNLDGKTDFGIAKVSLTGNISAHKENTRASDQSAKYHVDIRATNHGVPEGLARVLDMMAANIAPALVNSTPQGQNGQELEEQEMQIADRNRKLREEIRRLEQQLNAARDGLQMTLTRLRESGEYQLHLYRNQYKKLSASQETEDDSVKELREQAMGEVTESWSGFLNQVGELVRLMVDTDTSAEGVSELFALKALTGDGEAVAYDSGENYYEAMSAMQKRALKYQRDILAMEEELFARKAEYHDVLIGKR